MKLNNIFKKNLNVVFSLKDLKIIFIVFNINQDYKNFVLFKFLILKT